MARRSKLVSLPTSSKSSDSTLSSDASMPTPGPMDMAPMPFNGMQTSAPSTASFNPMSVNPMIPNSSVATQPIKAHSVSHSTSKSRPNIHAHNAEMKKAK